MEPYLSKIARCVVQNRPLRSVNNLSKFFTPLKMLIF